MTPLRDLWPGRYSATSARWLDEIFSGRWWWRIARHFAERRLARVLDRFGDQTLEARRATELCRRMQFAVTYWRSAPGPVMRVVTDARQAGVDESDLQLIVLNTDLRTRHGTVALRRSLLVRVLSIIFATVVGVHWILMYALAVTASGPIWLKIIVIVAVFAVYATLYRGWTLYASRALAAIEGLGDAVERACFQGMGGKLVHIQESKSRMRD